MNRSIRPLLVVCAMWGAAVSCLAATSQVERAHTDRTRRPVILVHGIADTARSMERLARHLRADGWEPHALSLTPNGGQVGLDVLAKQIDAYVERTFAPGQKIDLVGFSMGGLVGRFYVQRLGGGARVGRLITIATPHRGTRLAHLLPNSACRQMRPGSAFLRDLATDSDQLAKVGFTSIWTPLDLVILPARSSEVTGARNIKLPVALHPLMVIERRCLRAVAAALRS